MPHQPPHHIMWCGTKTTEYGNYYTYTGTALDARETESVACRLSVNQQLSSLEEEILCVLDKQSGLSGPVKLELRLLVSGRLSAAAQLIQGEIDRLHALLERVLNPDVKLHGEDIPLLPACKEESSSQQRERSHTLFPEEPEPPNFKEEGHQDFLHIPVCKDTFSPGQQDGSPSVVQDEPESPQIKEEQQELLQWPEEADWSTMTILTVKGEDDENMVTAPPVSSPTEHRHAAIPTSPHSDSNPIPNPNLYGRQTIRSQCRNGSMSEWRAASHMTTLADAEDCEASRPTGDAQIVSSHHSERDTENSDDWEASREAQSVPNQLKSGKTQNTEGQRSSMSSKLCQDVKSSKQTLYMRTHIGEKSLNCTVCDRSFVLNYDFKRHMRIHSGEKPFSCNVCGKSFVLKSDLKRHMGIHTGERPFTCKVCGNRYDRNSRLQEHMTIHPGEKPFSCKVCGKSFRVKDDLRTHVRTHAGEEDQPKAGPISCIFCGKIFSRKSNLKLHIRTHTGEKPFSCKVCGNSFSQTCHLKQHMKTHTGEKPFGCTLCGNSFSTNSHMKEHMRTHTGEKPYSCTVCGASFRINSHLKRHIRMHTGEKPFVCILCGANFSVKSNLKQHMRIHTGEKPFSCTLCGKSFNQSSSLNSHTRVHFSTIKDKTQMLKERIHTI